MSNNPYNDNELYFRAKEDVDDISWFLDDLADALQKYDMRQAREAIFALKDSIYAVERVVDDYVREEEIELENTSTEEKGS